jgi:hypothetical protein
MENNIIDISKQVASDSQTTMAKLIKRAERLESRIEPDMSIIDLITISKAINQTYTTAINLGQLTINASVESRRVQEHKLLYK